MTVSNLSLFRRPNGIWYVIYTVDGRRKWKSTKCSDRSEALEKLIQFKELVKKRPVENRFSTFLQEFLSYAHSTYAKPSIDIFNVALRNLQTITGDCRLTSLSFKHVDLYKAQRLKQVSPTSVNVELRSLRTIFNIALRWNLIETNPFCKVQLVRIPETVPTFFSKDDFQKLLVVVGNHWMRDFFIFAAMTGLRRGEILNLKWTDVNLDGKIAQIQSSPTFKVKTGKRRTIPLGDAAVKLLQDRARVSKSEFIFDHNGTAIRGDFLTKKLKSFIRKAGLNQRLHFHSLRHTFATWLVQGTVSIYEVQKLLGHADISTTMIYSHLVSSELHDAVNKISLRLE